MSTRLDKQLQFSSAQAITGDAISSVIDLGPLGGSNTIRDIAAAGNAGVMVQVSTALDSAGEAATLTITVESDSTADLATSPTVHATTGIITEATLATAGYVVYIPLPPGAYERYIGLRYDNATEAFTTGNLNAWLVHGPQPTWRAYSDNSLNSA